METVQQSGRFTLFLVNSPIIYILFSLSPSQTILVCKILKILQDDVTRLLYRSFDLIVTATVQNGTL